MNLLKLYFDEKFILILEISPLIIIIIFLFILVFFYKRREYFRKHFQLVSLDIKLGNVGKASFKPNIEDIQIAHRIWTELITRKAALKIDPKHDVIVEVYDSWYTLFTKIRHLIGEIPAPLIRREKSTQELVRIATKTLNDGLRPHLTRWQAQFRNWYIHQTEGLKLKSPQNLQSEFPEYAELVDDMLQVNGQLIQYAKELEKVIRGE